jgi:hypothetical protein
MRLSKFFRLIPLITDLNNTLMEPKTKVKVVEDKQKYWDSCAQLYDERIQLVTY